MLDGNAGHLDGLQFFNKTLVSPLNSLNSGDFRDNGDGGPLTTSPSSNVNYSGISGDRTFYRRFRNTSGATAIEYGLIAAGIAIAIVAVVGLLGDQLSALFTQVANALGGA